MDLNHDPFVVGEHNLFNPRDLRGECLLIVTASSTSIIVVHTTESHNLINLHIFNEDQPHSSGPRGGNRLGDPRPIKVSKRRRRADKSPPSVEIVGAERRLRRRRVSGLSVAYRHCEKNQVPLRCDPRETSSSHRACRL